MRPGTKYITLFRDEIVEEPPAPGIRVRRRVGLRTVRLRDPEGGPEMPLPPSLPPLDPIDIASRPEREVRRVERDETEPGGRIASTRTYGPRAAAKSYFDVVIVGDGYDKTERTKFKAVAKVLRQRLRSTAPFSTHRAKIRYHEVVAVSNQSGVSDWKGGGQCDTFFRIRFDQTPEVDTGFFVLDDVSLLSRAVQTIPLNAGEVDLFIVVVNAMINTACAYHEDRLVILAQGAGVDDEELGDLLLHEAGHAISDLAEERVTCVGMTPGEKHPNFATAEDRKDKVVPWQPLLDPPEQDPSGDFRVVHTYGMKLVDLDDRLDPVLPDPNDFDKLGLFWGCLCTDPAGNTSACPADDAGGKDFFRPMARCRMRDTRDPYCRACEVALATAIEWAYEPMP